MITQSLVTIGIFLALLACVPLALKWIKVRVPGNQVLANAQTRFISALAVGPHQRVVTVEVGPEGRRVWLTLGVTAQSISCLHSVDVNGEASIPGNGLQTDVQHGGQSADATNSVGSGGVA